MGALAKKELKVPKKVTIVYILEQVFGCCSTRLLF
jgi:hypothetical protein